MGNIFLMPAKIIMGEGVISEMGNHIKGQGSRALIVTDDFMVKSGNAAKVEAALEETGLDYAIYSGANAEPTDNMVMEGLQVYKENDCDCLVALGGGSPMDTAKAIAFMSTRPDQKISDFMHVEINWEVPYLAAIPTTAGTGSEATKNTIITDTENNVKMLLGGPSLIPALAVIDPNFTLSVPPKITAATGIDALTHCIEAYTSRKAQPLSDIFARSAIKRIYRNLLHCYYNGSSVEARLQLSAGALEAGIAFNNSSVTLVHGMSRPIGALFHIAHGVSNAILLPACMEFAVRENIFRFAEIARLMKVADRRTDDKEAAQRFIAAVTQICRDVEIPTLAQLGVDRHDFFKNLDKMAEDALESGSPQNTVRVPSKEQIKEIYKKLWD